MLQIFITLFILGGIVVFFALYRNRREGYTKYSWLSYLALGLSVLLLLALFSMQEVTQHLLLLILTTSIAIGSPLALILNLIALFKKNEKNVLAVIGLFISLILIGVLIIIGIFVTTPGNP